MKKMNEEKHIMFLCDKKKDCNHECSGGLTCRHTADPEHAAKEIHTTFLRDSHDPNLWWACDPDE